MPHVALRLSLVAILSLALGSPLLAQDAGGDQELATRPRVYFDCQGGPHCNSTYYRTEIPWVTWVRDQADAHLHVIVTDQNTGVGGREYQLDFLGLGERSDYVDQTLYQSLPTDTQRERLDGVNYALAVGFARFAQYAGFRNIVQFSAGEGGAPPPDVGLVTSEEVQDPWNLWVFRMNGNGNFRGESSEQRRQFRGGFNASRVTPTWKQNYNFFINYNFQENDLSDGVFVDERTDFNVNTTVVYAVAEHWSVGFTSRVGRNVRQNQQRTARLTPALEYSFFPYEEATRRSLTAFYEIGPEHFDYLEETQDRLFEETRFQQRLSIEFAQRQPWGDAQVRLQGSHFLHDLDRNNLELRGELSFRVTRGLDVDVGANYIFVADQLYLPLAELSDEEILTGARRIATDKEYGIFFGLSYQFGSIFNNVVNNRFPGGGGGGFGGGGGGGGGFN